jgi:hypothetical protein
LTNLTYPATVVLAGTGETTPNNIKDLLSDWVGDAADPPTPKDVMLYLVTTIDSCGDTTEHIVDWLVGDMGLPFSIITDNREPTEDLGYIYEEAKGVRVVEPGAVVTTAIKVLTDAAAKNHDTHLVLSWGPQDEAPDAVTDELFMSAHKAKIIPEDLSQGLEDLLTQAPAEPAPEPEKPRERRGRGRKQAKSLEAEEKPLSEPESAPEPADAGQEGDRLKRAVELLARTFEYQLKIDGFLERESRLTKEVGAFLREVSASDKSAEKIAVYVNDADRTVRKARRGRPRKGEEPKNMTLAEIESKYGPQDWS